MPTFDLGESIPADTAHAVSVSLPTWKANVGYEEGESWVVDKMVTGYPRFFIHRTIQAFASDILAKFGKPSQGAMLFPTKKTAQRCVQFIKDKAAPELLEDLEVVNLVLDSSNKDTEALQAVRPAISAVLYKKEAFPVAKQYWQHSGDGVSSRRAEFCQGLLRDNLLVLESSIVPGKSYQKCRGPRRYQQRPASIDATPKSNSLVTDAAATKNGVSEDATEALESSRFIEARFGRNLDVSLVNNAKSAIRRRIAGTLTDVVDLTSALPSMESDARGVTNFREDDVYLFPCGMNAIFTAHQTMLKSREPRKSINFGFPYVDTLKILEKFGPGCVFYGHASSADLDDLEARLERGERFLGLFCEFPGNPLLTSPDLARIRRLADAYDFLVVVDDTIGTFHNVNVLPFADAVASSLTKIFSGDSNVMGGSLVLNPTSRHYGSLKETLARDFEDTYWAEDVIFMERNSRDFISRIERVNANSEAICEVLAAHPSVAKVYYPKYNESRANYEAVKTPAGGYGGLVSCSLKDKATSVAVFDALDTAKGPSLGTNFTLTSPYVILAHYGELDWAESYGVDPNLLRFSVGLEETEELKAVFRNALKAAEEITNGSS